MFENVKMREILDKLDQKTIDDLRQRWPEINYLHYNARDVLRRMDIKTLTELYVKGLEINCANLAVLAAEALISYDVDHRYSSYNNVSDTSVIHHVVVKKLQEAFDKNKLVMGSNLVNTLGFTLLDSCYEFDRLLAKYGQQLSRGTIFMGPEDWFRESAKRSKYVPVLAQSTPWAKALLT